MNSLGRTFLFTLIILLFAGRNVPWNLDDYDQAKQAYTSYEMVRQSHWMFQHTPYDKVATKPPLAGWISALVYYPLGGWWDVAWRLPSLICALVLLWLMVRVGDGLLPVWGGPVAASALAFNMMTPRLATLVRTDIMLGLWLFLAGLMIWHHVHTSKPWSKRDRWLFCAVLLASMLTKGPAACFFLLPGLAFFQWHHWRSKTTNFAWCGWWPWLLPLAVVGAWAALGCVAQPGFYEQVVVKEFLGRVTGEHRSQPVYFYIPHFLQKFAPWSLLLVALFCVRPVRQSLRANPGLLWLAAWGIGGFLFMSVIPSKRPDRIFPVLLPFCLMLPALLARLPSGRLGTWSIDRIAKVTITIAAVGSIGYAGFLVREAIMSDKAGLVRFGENVRSFVAAQNLQLGVVKTLDEGLIIYTGQDNYMSGGNAIRLFEQGKIQALVMPDTFFEDNKDKMKPHEVIATVGQKEATSHAYVFVVSKSAATSPGD